jgi:taurine dioxygenase
MAFKVTKQTDSLGAEISGLDLRAPMDAETLIAVRAAWLDNLVLRFRGQKLSDAELIAFSEQFGELDRVPTWDQFHPVGHPEVLVVSNVTEGGKAIGVLGDGEASWHTDMAYIERPPTASVLHAHEVPASGGDTSYLNMYAVLDALPTELLGAIDGRQLNHDETHDSSGNLRPGKAAAGDVSAMPGARHPMIRLHPETGKKALFLGRRLNAHIIGMAVADSDALLDKLWQICARDEFIFRHQWQLGDVLMWDNRCTMHRREAFDPAARRIMHRTEIIGEVPVAAGVT